jgi:hypothetical protein
LLGAVDENGGAPLRRPGVTVFYGMAKPVRAPQMGPARPY